MAHEAIDSLLESARGGVWFLPKPVEPRAVQAAAKRAGFAYFHVDGKNISRKEQLLNHVATALHFPNDFGHNWDAL
ncbi:MAG TPA: barstar family protein, partial [Usitatibacter sp.]|nr:barstar family protein [Usitatibacter sp.]